MVSAEEIAAAKAVPITEVVGAAVELRRDFGLCPFHDERSPSLHVHRRSNTFYCFGCGARGDAIEFVRKLNRLDFQTAVRDLIGGRSADAISLRQRAPRATEVPPLVSELWRAADGPHLAKFYLESRGVAQRALPSALRGHKAVWCVEAGERRPAMLAAITDSAGGITALQRTYLNAKLEYDGTTQFQKGARSLDLRAPKKCLGPLGSGAVKLAAAGDVLGLSESVESALAAAKLFRLPVWATCGAARLGNIEMPVIVRHVVIFGDADDAGRAAASKAESAYRARGYGCQAEFPQQKDFAEALIS